MSAYLAAHGVTFGAIAMSIVLLAFLPALLIRFAQHALGKFSYFGLPATPAYPSFEHFDVTFKRFINEPTIPIMLIQLMGTLVTENGGKTSAAYVPFFIGLIAELVGSLRAWEVLYTSLPSTVHAQKEQTWLQVNESMLRLLYVRRSLRKECPGAVWNIFLCVPANLTAALVSPSTLAKTMILVPTAVLTVIGMSPDADLSQQQSSQWSIVSTAVLSGALDSRLSEGLWIIISSKVTGGTYTDALADRCGDCLQARLESGLSLFSRIRLWASSTLAPACHVTFLVNKSDLLSQSSVHSKISVFVFQ